MFRLKTLTAGPLAAGLGAAVLSMASAGLALAQDAAAEPTPTLDTGDTAWMLVSTLLVLMMTIPGVALFYGGMVRKKNVLATMMQSFAITCLVSILWYVFGYPLAFGEGTPYVGDLSNLFLSGLDPASLSGTFPETVFIVFQMTFAIITAALITGSIADRMKFSALLWFVALWLLVVYAPICHWVWGGGFLGEMGVLDFAGGTVVHINAGIAGLVAAIVLGKRKGYGVENMSPHNLTLSVIGAALLWVGWFGFNAGSAVAANNAAGMAMLVTQLATAAAALAWMFIEWMLRGKASVLGIISGAVAGLVAITPAAGFVGPGASILIGIASGIVCYIASTTVKRALGYDDSLDCFGIHGIGGIVGAILTGVFAAAAIGDKPGLLEGNGGQLWLQFVGVGVTIIYVAVATFIILKIIDVVIGLRVNAEQEIEGLDQTLHGETVH